MHQILKTNWIPGIGEAVAILFASGEPTEDGSKTPPNNLASWGYAAAFPAVDKGFVASESLDVEELRAWMASAQSALRAGRGPRPFDLPRTLSLLGQSRLEATLREYVWSVVKETSGRETSSLDLFAVSAEDDGLRILLGGTLRAGLKELATSEGMSYQRGLKQEIEALLTDPPFAVLRHPSGP